MTPKVTDTILYHFVRSLADQWQTKKEFPHGSREELAVFLCEALCATLDRIDAQEAQVERRATALDAKEPTE